MKGTGARIGAASAATGTMAKDLSTISLREAVGRWASGGRSAGRQQMPRAVPRCGRPENPDVIASPVPDLADAVFSQASPLCPHACTVTRGNPTDHRAHASRIIELGKTAHMIATQCNPPICLTRYQ